MFLIVIKIIQYKEELWREKIIQNDAGVYP